MNWGGVILAGAVGVASGVAMPGYAGAQTLDYEVFKASVEPIFITKREGYTRCVVCHGGANNALRLERPGPRGFTEEQSKKNFETVVRLVGPRKPDVNALFVYLLV